MEVHGVAFVERVNLASGWYFYLHVTVMTMEMRCESQGRTSGWVRINSPSAASRVYPLTPDPVERTRLADEPYLASPQQPIVGITRVTYMVYPAATISLPGLSTSSSEPNEPGRCDTLVHRFCAKAWHDTYQRVDPKDRADVNTSVDVATAVEGVKNDAVLASVTFFDDDRVLELFGNENSRLARSPEGIDHDVIGQDVQLLLFLPLDICFSRKSNAVTDTMRSRRWPSRNTYRLMRRALRTLVAINLDVTWMAVRSKVRSPVAAAPRRS